MILRTLDEIAAYIGVASPTVARYIEDGLPASRIGSSWTTSTDLIDKWIMSRHLTDVRAKKELRALRAMRRAAVQRMLEASGAVTRLEAAGDKQKHWSKRDG